MGNGYEIVLADGNFPTVSHANHLIRCDGHGIPRILDAIPQLMPLDTYVECPISLMALSPVHAVKPVIRWPIQYLRAPTIEIDWK